MPLELLDREAVHRTVLFFGSARAMPRPEWDAAHAAAAAASDDEQLANLSRIHWMCEWYDKTVELAAAVAKWQATREDGPEYVISTGGGPGLMEAANRGAQEGGARSMGVAVSLPFEARMNAFVDEQLAIKLHYFSTRKMVLADPACAIVALPGGFGTMDELFELATLLQTGKVGGMHDDWKTHMPVVLFGACYWNQVLNLQAAVDMGTLARADVDRLVVTDSTEEALAAITSGLVRVEAAWEAAATGGAAASSASRGRAYWGSHSSQGWRRSHLGNGSEGGETPDSPVASPDSALATTSAPLPAPVARALLPAPVQAPMCESQPKPSQQDDLEGAETPASELPSV